MYRLQGMKGYPKCINEDSALQNIKEEAKGFLYCLPRMIFNFSYCLKTYDKVNNVVTRYSALWDPWSALTVLVPQVTTTTQCQYILKLVYFTPQGKHDEHHEIHREKDANKQGLYTKFPTTQYFKDKREHVIQPN